MSQPQPQSPPQSPASRTPQPGSQPAAIVQKGLHPLPAPVKGAVITVSDRCAAGEREDASGPLAVELLRAHDVIVEGVKIRPALLDKRDLSFPRSSSEVFAHRKRTRR